MLPSNLKRMIYNVLYVHLERGTCEEKLANDYLLNAIKRNKAIQIINIKTLRRK